MNSGRPGAWGKFFRWGKKEDPVPQSEKEKERRELTERLIEEHRSANTSAREHVKAEVRIMNARYLDSMNLATAILKGR